MMTICRRGAGRGCRRYSAVAHPLSAVELRSRKRSRNYAAGTRCLVGALRLELVGAAAGAYLRSICQLQRLSQMIGRTFRQIFFVHLFARQQAPADSAAVQHRAECADIRGPVARPAEIPARQPGRPGAGPTARIENHRDRNGGIIDRSESGERCHIFGVRIGVRWRDQFLRRAGFSRRGISFQDCLFPGACQAPRPASSVSSALRSSAKSPAVPSAG